MIPAGRAALLFVSACAALSSPAAGQTGPTVAVGIDLAPSWEESQTPGSLVSRTGLLREGSFRLGVSLVGLDAWYRQGRLSASGGADPHDLVEGQALLGLRFGPWLTLEAGPRVRAYTTPAGTERWVLWEGQARVAAPVIRPGGWAYLRVGRVLGADLPGLTLDHGQGADAGLELRMGSTPLWAHLSYWVHRASATGALRQETLQGMSVGVRLRHGGAP